MKSSMSTILILNPTRFEDTTTRMRKMKRLARLRREPRGKTNSRSL